MKPRAVAAVACCSTESISSNGSGSKPNGPTGRDYRTTGGGDKHSKGDAVLGISVQVAQALAHIDDAARRRLLSDTAGGSAVPPLRYARVETARVVSVRLL